MHQTVEATPAVQALRPGLRRWDEPADVPRIRWTIPLSTATPDGSGIEQRQNSPGQAHYDAVDRRLMDTFPASDAVARY